MLFLESKSLNRAIDTAGRTALLQELHARNIVPVIRSPCWVRLKYVRRKVPSVAIGTAVTQFPVTFGRTDAVTGAATGGGVTMTGALDAQPETTAIATAEVIERTKRIRIGDLVGVRPAAPIFVRTADVACCEARLERFHARATGRHPHCPWRFHAERATRDSTRQTPMQLLAHPLDPRSCQ